MLKALQANLTQLLKLYDDSKDQHADEIRSLEADNQQLAEQLRQSKSQSNQQQQQQSFNNASSFSSPIMQETSIDAFGTSASDPFQAVDPFSSSAFANDPFKASSNGQQQSAAAAFDPFGTSFSADPFAANQTFDATDPRVITIFAFYFFLFLSIKNIIY